MPLSLQDLTKAVDKLEPHRVKKMYFYMLPRNIYPSLIVNISEEVEQLKEALQCYKSQMDISFSGKSNFGYTYDYKSC